MNARTPRTRAALSYVGLMRCDATRTGEVTWFDVADAFDAGQRQALRRPHEARRQLADVDERRNLEAARQEQAKK